MAADMALADSVVPDKVSLMVMEAIGIRPVVMAFLVVMPVVSPTSLNRCLGNGAEGKVVMPDSADRTSMLNFIYHFVMRLKLINRF